MASDIKLNEDQIAVECRVLKVTATDLLLDSPDRRKKGASPIKIGADFRRALVHNFEDKLTLNFEGDYPGGVTIEGPHLTVQQLRLVNPNAKEGKGSPGGRALVQDDTDALVLNQGGFYEGGVTVEGPQLTAQQIRLVNPKAKEGKGSPGGRAMVQDEDDSLVLNQGGFYEGGVTVEGKVSITGSLFVLNPEAPKAGFLKANMINLAELVVDLKEKIKVLEQDIAKLKAK